VSGLPNTMTAVLGQPSTWSLDLSPDVFLAVAVVGGVLAALVSGALAYVMRWQQLASRAEARRRRINESLARTVAFLYVGTFLAAGAWLDRRSGREIAGGISSQCCPSSRGVSMNWCSSALPIPVVLLNFTRHQTIRSRLWRPSKAIHRT
jgi:TRAP-type C4-dicarboxylate transport system permease small subunit